MNKQKKTNNILPLKLYHAHIETIKSAQQNNSLAIFIGAGFSMATSDKYKSWTEIINELKKGLNSKEETDYLKIAQLYELEHGKKRTKEMLQSMFPEIDHPGELQDLLLTLKPHYIISTNWDCLIDNKIYDNSKSYGYDIVATDQDLVEKQNPNKFIKMHGDFKHNNFVFTEDDYLNYSNNFPLIENFVKSILATHTSLFIGYSFSDINLKQIFNWIQNNSKYQPPAFMLIENGRYNHSEEKYLQKFNINILPLLEDKGFDRDLNSFLKHLKTDVPSEFFDPYDYIFLRLQPLDAQETILTDHIRQRLTNCDIVYDENSRAVLEFTHKYFTWDKDHDKLEVFKKFEDKMKEDNDTDLFNKKDKIIKILMKADIHGIILGESSFPNQKYLNFDKPEDSTIYINHSTALDFSHPICEIDESKIADRFINIYNMFSLELYDKAIEECSLLIQYLRKYNNTKMLLLAYFNYNILLKVIKPKNNCPEKYKNESLIDITKEYRNFPKKDQDECVEIYEFCNFYYFYQKSFYLRQDLIKIEKQVSKIQKGSFVYSDDGSSYFGKHKNLIDYVLSNGILIERTAEYRAINKTYVEIALNRQIEKERVRLNKYELFSCIKYFLNDELFELLNKFIKENSKKFVLHEKQIDWLVEVAFSNCIDNYINIKIGFNQFEIYIRNILLLFSFIEMTDKNIARVLQKITKLMETANITFGIFESINSFFGIQYNFFKTEFSPPEVLGIIEKLLEKYVKGQLNLFEYRAITQNKLFNLLGYIKYLNFEFTKIELLESFFLRVELNKESVQDLTNMAQYILLSIYYISDDACKNKIKDFMLSVKDMDNNDTEQRLYFLLVLLHVEILDNYQEVATELESYLSGIQNLNRVSLRYPEIKKILKILNKDHPVFKNSLNLISELIEKQQPFFPQSFI